MVGDVGRSGKVRFGIVNYYYSTVNRGNVYEEE